MSGSFALPRGPDLSTRGHSRDGWLWVCALFVFLSAFGPAAADPPYEGRLLLDVLRELQEQGLELIYSTELVRPGTRVTIEPTSNDPRTLLHEILEPLGLEAGDGPSGAILIVVRTRNGGSLSGRVLTRLRGLPVAGATITIGDGARQAVSGDDGSFRILDLAPGRHKLLVQAMGFWPVNVLAVRIASRTETELTVQLEGQPTFLAEVVVTPRLSVERQEQVARRTVDNDDSVLVPTIGGDISRVIDLLPGVAYGDNSAGFHVRGSARDDVSVILDGLELYDPFHLKSFQSPFSLVDGKVVDRIDFLGGGFTADLGDRHGGFVEISTLLPDSTNRGEIELGTLNSRVAFSSQNEDGSRSWLFSVRGWYPEAFRDTLELGGGERVDPRFGDAYGKVSFMLSPSTIVSAHGLLSYDRLDFVEAADVDGPGESAGALTRNGYLWARVRKTTNALTADTVVSGGQIHRFRDGFSKPQEDAFVVNDERRVDFLGLKHDSAWQVTAAHLLKAGIDVRRMEARYRYSRVPVAEPAAATSTAFSEQGVSLAMYVSHRARVSTRLATEVGLRWDRQTYTGDNQLSPRFNAVWRLGERSDLRIGVGRYSQSQRIHELNVEDGQTAYQQAEISKEVDVTYQLRFGSGLKLRGDAYYREQSMLRPRFENLFEPLELFPETGSDRILVAPEAARLRGAEFLLRGDASSALTWWVSYALSSAEDVIDGTHVARGWDQTHSAKFLVGHRWDDRWSVSLSGTAHTGWPTTPITAETVTLPDGSMEIQRVLGPRNTDRLSHYRRLDAKVVRVFQTSRGRFRLALEVANLTDRKNACCIDEFLFLPQPDGSVDVDRELDQWLGTTPSFSILWEF